MLLNIEKRLILGFLKEDKMVFLKFIFYIGMLIPLICEASCIFSTRKMIDISLRLKEIGKLPSTERFKSLSEDKELSSTVFMHLFYLTWLFFGLFSSLNWPIFLFLLLESFIPKRIFLLRFADGVISFSLLMFALINAFHLHINMFAFLTTIVKG